MYKRCNKLGRRFFFFTELVLIAQTKHRVPFNQKVEPDIRIKTIKNDVNALWGYVGETKTII